MDLDLLEEIDISGDQGELDNIRGDVAVLNRYYDDISAQGGITRDQAKLLVRDCGVQFGDNCPITSFTEVPSRTNLSIAMEGMVSTAARMVWDLIKKAAALLMKIARWIVDALRQRLGLKRDAVKAANAVSQVNKLNQKYEGAVNKDLSSPVIDKAKATLAEAQASYDSNFNDLVMSMLTDEKFTTTVRNIGIELLAFHEVIEAKIDLFHDLVTSHLNAGDSGAMITLQGQLRTIAQPIEGRNIQLFMRNSHIQIPDNTLISCMDSLRQAQSALRNSKVAHPISADAAALLLERGVETFSAPFILHDEEWIKVMDRMSHALNQLGQIHPAGQITQEVANAYAQAFDVISKEVQAMRLFVVVADACRTVRDQFLHDMLRVVMAEVMLTEARADASEDKSLKNHIRQDLNHVAQAVNAA